jgi:exocyst complex component 8
VAARRTTRVDDKIKKRMSMRYADISSPTNALIPAVPIIPLALRPGVPGRRDADTSAYQGTDEREEGRREEEAREAELRMLDQERFDPDACESSCDHFMHIRSNGLVSGCQF